MCNTQSPEMLPLFYPKKKEHLLHNHAVVFSQPWSVPLWNFKHASFLTLMVRIWAECDTTPIWNRHKKNEKPSACLQKWVPKLGIEFDLKPEHYFNNSNALSS